jgi:hypothetical protein
MRIIYTFILCLIINFPLLAEGNNNVFFNNLLQSNLNNDTQHLFVTNFTKNNTLKIFNHENIIYITDYKTTDENKIKIIKIITLIDKLIKKRKELFTLSSNLSTYHVLQLTEDGESDVKTKDSLTELFKLINNLDLNIINGLKKIKELYTEKT